MNTVSVSMKSKHQLAAQIQKLTKELTEAQEQIRFLQRAVTDRNQRADRAERGARAAQVALEAVRKLFVDGDVARYDRVCGDDD
jgi:hypothetical protein